MEEECIGEIGGRRIGIQNSLTKIKRKFSRREEELVKAAELRKLEQREKTIEEFVQEFKRAARRSKYGGGS